jgi:serine O-acetyltransferase
MAANSMIFGDSKIGDNTVIGVGAIIKNKDIPANSIVFGHSPNLIIKTNKQSQFTNFNKELMLKI